MRPAVKRKTKGRAYPEEFIQSAVADHLRLRKKPGVVWWHTPNGGKRGPQYARKLKQHGVLAGVSDILLFYHHKLYCLELKSEDGRPSEAQLEFIGAMDKQGAFCAVSYGLDAALGTLEAWGLISETEWIGRAQ